VSSPDTARAARRAGGAGLLIVAGPCALEDRDDAFAVARAMRELCAARGLRYVFKSSFDKANRTSGASYRGPGFDAGLALLADIREALDVRVLTDVHEPWQCAPAAAAVDILQIPAFLCRQTDLLAAAGATGRVVHVKKGPFLAPWQAIPMVAKVRDAGAREVWIGERGTTFGHGDLVVDFRALLELHEATDTVLFDATHSAQRPGGHGDRSGGDRRVVPLLTRAAAAAGFDGLYVEVHPDPSRARSDAEIQWPLGDAAALIDEFVAHRRLT
jgi:2-dehydro-3-deoxyphosphooctonate aldolase (KDO 8-P synthase)